MFFSSLSRWTSRRPEAATERSARRQRAALRRALEPLEQRTLMAVDLLRDIHPNPFGMGPSGFEVVGSTAYFTADDGMGRELWRTDGTPDGTVPVLPDGINGGPGGSDPADLTVVGGTLFFSANNGTQGRELWRIDGPAGFPELVSDLREGLEGSNPANLMALGGTLFFAADDGEGGGVELYRIDSTAGGIELVSDINMDAASSAPEQLTAVGATLFFTAVEGAQDRELYRIDGPSGTPARIEIEDGTNGSDPQQLTDVGGTLFFSADNGIHGVELWRSDGTEAGTVRVSDINPDVADSNPEYLTDVGGTLYFSADNGDFGIELWRSDGTEAGTVRVSDINPNGADSEPRQLTDVGGTLFFTARDGPFNRELYRVDAPASDAERVFDIFDGPGGSDPEDLTAVGNTVFFSALDGATGRELWRSDGTSAGTARVRDINEMPFIGSNPASLTLLNGNLLLVGNNGMNGREPLVLAGLIPMLDPIADITVAEESLLSFTATVTNPGPSPEQVLQFSLDPGAPAGAAIDAATGLFTWTPTEAQGPGSYNITVRVTNVGAQAVPGTSDTETFTVTVTEDGLPPTLAPIADLTAAEGSLVTVTATVVGPVLPANALQFSLDAGAPTGAAIDAATGVFTWTPSEAQGPGTFTITVRATNVAEPGTFDTESFTVTVTEDNQPPTLAPLADLTVAEGSPATVTAAASDPDLPANTLQFSLDAGAPAGASINPVTGAFTWTPTEAQGPGTFTITVRVTEAGTPGLSAMRSFTITVTEANQPPTLAPIANLTVSEGSPATFTAAASDPDLPANTLRFSLDAGAPAGASIDPVTGVFTWTPPRGAPSTTVTVRVTDDATPGLSASQAVTITVLPVPVRVVSKQFATRGRRRIGIALTFSEDLDAAAVANLANYRLVSAGRDRVFGTPDDRVVQIRSAVYDAATRTVTVTVRGGLALARPLQLTVNGTSPSGVADALGRLLDGDRDGRPGGDSRASLTRAGITATA